MRTIVTGAGGFIGSHLVDALYKEGHTVIALDRFSHGIREHRKGKSDHQRIFFQKVDISQQKDLKPEYFRGVDWLFHLAARSGNPKSLVNPWEFHNVNVTGTINILEAARLAGVKRFIYAASSTCYGQQPNRAIEETETEKPLTPYGLTKLLGEQYVLHWGRVYNLPVLSLRLFFVYGPKIRASGTYGSLVTMYLEQADRFGQAVIYGKGDQVRDFTYVDDAVRAFIAAARSTVKGEIINIGSGEKSDMNKMLRLLKIKATYANPLAGEILFSYPDIQKAVKVIGWHPQVNLEQGLKVVLQSYAKDTRLHKNISEVLRRDEGSKTLTYYLTPQFSGLNRQSEDFIRQEAAKDPVGRARICLHENKDSIVHEMMIAQRKTTYVRPHRHHGKTESAHIIHGRMFVVTFDNFGRIDRVFYLKAGNRDGTSIIRMTDKIWHTQIPLSDDVVISETITGPFSANSSEYASWAPTGTDFKEASIYTKKLLALARLMVIT
jgi:UDP-glucose 4-epimerase